MSEPYDPNPPYRIDPGYQAQPRVGPNQAQPDQAQPDQAQPYSAPPWPSQSFGPGAAPGPYPAPMYSIYPYPGGTSGGRPGRVVAAAVLSYIEAGWLILTGLVLFSGSSVVSNWSSGDNGGDYGWGAQFAFAGLGDLVAAGLLITGGVMFTGGNRLGRTLLATALAVGVIEAICWISWLGGSSGAIVPWAVFYLVMPVIATSMSYGGSVGRWLASRPA